MTAEQFGTLPSGDIVHRLAFGDDALHVSVLTFGATLQSIRIAGVPHSLCLGYDSLDRYLEGGSVGAVVGRVANRIGNGIATIAGRDYRFDRNDGGRHTLHGGRDGSGRQNWAILDSSPRGVSLGWTAADGHMGFPGTLNVTAKYRVLSGGILELVLEAQTDAPTLCNLAPHPYFNLDGTGDARAQKISVASDAVTAIDREKIPTGQLELISGTAWDFREPTSLLENDIAYDHNFCLSHQRTGLRPVASLSAARSDITMEIETTEPGLQVYDGAGLTPPFAGIALEPQCWPDAPHHPHFPSIVLTPGETSRQITRFVFRSS